MAPLLSAGGLLACLIEKGEPLDRNLTMPPSARTGSLMPIHILLPSYLGVMLFPLKTLPPPLVWAPSFCFWCLPPFPLYCLFPFSTQTFFNEISISVSISCETEPTFFSSFFLSLVTFRCFPCLCTVWFLSLPHNLCFYPQGPRNGQTE